LPADNARITRGVLERSLDGPRRDVVLLNAGAALAAGGKAGNLREGLEMAVESLDSGAARRTLDQFIEYTQSVNREA
jgi:anthranilate phosphoribosyltransferase